VHLTYVRRRIVQAAARRVFVVVGAALPTLVAAAAAWSSGIIGRGPAQIRVYGDGQVAAPTVRTISFDAVANLQGQGAYGTLRYAAVAPRFGDDPCRAACRGPPHSADSALIS
jgi:hypothetical protein